MTKSAKRRQSRKNNNNEIDAIFTTELEPITEELINELVLQGLEKERILEAKNLGLKYNRVRKSFMSDWSI